MNTTHTLAVLLLATAAPVLAQPSAPAPAPAPSAAAPAAKEPAATEPKAPVVRYANDKVTVSVQGIPASAVVNEIARLAGAKVTGTVERTTPITADWTDLPLKDALPQILGTQNFTLTYSEEGALRVIQLRGSQQAGGAGSDAATAEDEKRAESAETAFFNVWNIHGTVPIEGAIAKRLGKSEAPWDLLTNTAIADEDPEVRRSAVKAGMEAFEASETLRQETMKVTGGMTDAQLAAFARARMYHRAEDFLRNVRRATTLPDVRTRASDILRELRKIPFRGPIPHEMGGSSKPE